MSFLSRVCARAWACVFLGLQGRSVPDSISVLLPATRAGGCGGVVWGPGVIISWRPRSVLVCTCAVWVACAGTGSRTQAVSVCEGVLMF